MNSSLNRNELRPSGPPSLVEQMQRLPTKKSKTRWRTLVIGILLASVTGVVIFTSITFEQSWKIVMNRWPDGKIRQVTAMVGSATGEATVIICKEGTWTGHIQFPTSISSVTWSRNGTEVAMPTTVKGSQLVFEDPRTVAAAMAGTEALDLNYVDSTGVAQHTTVTTKGFDTAMAALVRACP